jgi:hypothetical protein
MAFGTAPDAEFDLAWDRGVIGLASPCWDFAGHQNTHMKNMMMTAIQDQPISNSKFPGRHVM